jgi:hypothetical protein
MHGDDERHALAVDADPVPPWLSVDRPFQASNHEDNRFFTPPFSDLETVYQSWEALIEEMAADIKRLDEPVAYDRCWRRTYDLACSLYSTEQFRKNLRMYYRGEYTFP